MYGGKRAALKNDLEGKNFTRIFLYHAPGVLNVPNNIVK